MDTKTFLSLLVPEQGTKFAVEIRKTKGVNGKKNDTTIHTAVETLDELAETVLTLDTAATAANARGNPTRNVYFALASFKEPKYKTVQVTRNGSTEDFTFTVGRDQDNALLVKCFWQDFDVGKSDTAISYETRQEAVTSLKRYLQETGLPVPLLVNSGYGFHAYWPFTEAVSAFEWSAVAVLQRTVFRHLGVKFDTARDKDCSSVLRPLGCHNNKPGMESKEVKLVDVGPPCAPRSIEYYRLKLQAYITAHNLDVPVVANRKTPQLNADLIVDVEFEPVYADVIAGQCNQIGAFKFTGGSSEPVWHRCVGVLKHAVDGHAKVHEYSAQYPGYDYDECQRKIDLWTAGPTTCTNFKEINPSRCVGCAQTCKSPIQLGIKADVQNASVNPVEEVEEQYPFMPKKFGLDKRGIKKYVTNPETGAQAAVHFASPAFYFTYCHEKEDKTWALRTKVEFKPGKWTEFDLDSAKLAKKESLVTALAAYRITIYDADLAMNYTSNYQHNLRKHVADVNRYKQFGWTPDFNGFLIGNSLINEKGEVIKVRLSDDIVEEIHDIFAIKGTAQEWVDGVDFLYNQEGAEMYQYAIGAQFGSVLSRVLENSEWSGIPLALTSDKSGYGKSTAVRIAINGLYDCQKGMLTDSTKGAALNRLSYMNNLPVVFDEITHWLPDTKEMQALLYSASNGKARIRLTSSGKESKPAPDFCGGSTMTGNQNVLFQLAESKTNPEATSMRVFEIDLRNDYPRLATMKNLEDDGWEHPNHQQHRDVASKLLSEVSGVLAVPYITYAMRNRVDIRERINALNRKITTKLGGRSTKERFYAYHVACTVVALQILSKLEFIRFDVRALLHWGVEHIYKLRLKADDATVSTDDKFSMMMADFHGKVLITRHFDTLDARSSKTELPMLPMRSSPVARLVLHSPEERGKLYVSVQAIDAWCREHHISVTQFKADLVQEGIIRRNLDNKIYKSLYLAKGVPTVTLGQARVIEFDYNRAQGYIAEFVEGSKVVDINVAKSVADDEGPESESVITA